MKKQLYLFFILSASVFATTPNLYKPVGDPVFSQINSVSKMSNITYFKNEKKKIDALVTEIEEIKRVGFMYDKKRISNTLTTKEQKEYLQKLRELKSRLSYISILVQNSIPIIIQKNDIKTFEQLKETNLEVLKEDKKIRLAIKEFDKKLRQREREKDEKSKIAYAKMLMSPENLEGKWEGKSSDGTKMSAVFDSKKLSLLYVHEEYTNVLNGTYKIDKNLIFNISKRDLVKNDLSHVREVNLVREYKIKEISKKALVLQYKDEVLDLTR